MVLQKLLWIMLKKAHNTFVMKLKNLFISVGVFIHWLAEDDKKIQEYNYQATKESIERAVSGEPKAKDVVSQKFGRASICC